LPEKNKFNINQNLLKTLQEKIRIVGLKNKLESEFQNYREKLFSEIQTCSEIKL